MLLALLWALVAVCVAYRSVQETSTLGTGEESVELDLQSNTSRAGAEVYVMLPLDIVTNEGRIGDPHKLASWLGKVRNVGVDGFMVDVWWGVTETQPKVYNFDAYKELVAMAENLNMKVQLVASFHQCGGNVGDTCSIPLPDFVRQNQGIWYKDRAGRENKEYISLFADDEPLQDGRTPLDMYSDWLVNLSATFDDKLGNTVTEIQVGMGPCGELRYPSYLFAHGWQYCGIGEFQAWDQHALASLRRESQRKSATVPKAAKWTQPPGDAGSYNSRPEDGDVRFFRHGHNNQPGYQTEYGKFFLDWYSGSLKGHAAKVLEKASEAFKGKVALAGKVAGIHWWYDSYSHAAELTAGYYNTNNHNAYDEIAQVFRDSGNAALDFTCLEMKNPQWGEDDKCKSRPESLVGQVIHAAKNQRVQFNGENALPVHSWGQYDKILQKKPEIHAFTFLRLNEQLVNQGLGDLQGFVKHMHR